MKTEPVSADTARTVSIGGCVLGGDNPTRIIVPLMGTSVDALTAEAGALQGHPVDLVEWRVDPMIQALGEVGIDEAEAALASAARQVVEACSLPVIATIRTANEGGCAELSDTVYVRLAEALAHAVPAVDVEIMRQGAADCIAAVRRVGAVVIASNHDFDATPDDDRLGEIFQVMNRADADVLKIACRANNSADAVRVLAAQVWAKAAFDRPIIAIAMGQAGAITRIAGSHLGSAATFATVGASSAPGQMTAEQTRTALDLVEGNLANAAVEQ